MPKFATNERSSPPIELDSGGRTDLTMMFVAPSAWMSRSARWQRVDGSLLISLAKLFVEREGASVPEAVAENATG